VRPERRTVLNRPSQRLGTAQLKRRVEPMMPPNPLRDTIVRRRVALSEAVVILAEAQADHTVG
jgi:hypothetical protein